MDVGRFTDGARAAFAGSREIMRTRRNPALGAEHLLLALLRQTGGTVERVLRELGADQTRAVELVERELERLPTLESQEEPGDQVMVTPRVQRLLQRAHAQADQLGDSRVGTAHLLLAIAAEVDAPGARALTSLGVTQERVGEAVVNLRHPIDGVPHERQAPMLMVEERLATLEAAVAELRAQTSAPPPMGGLQAELEQAQQRIAALERQNRYLEELLKITQDTLSSTRGLLEQAVQARVRP